MYVSIFLAVIFIACFASLMNAGLWSNTLNLVNVVTSALVATNYFEPLATWLQNQEPSLAYVWDFFALWLLFGITMVVTRAATDYLSPLKVRFFLPVEKVGGIVMCLWTCWVLLGFTTMTLHTAPLARNFFRGSFQAEPEAKMLLLGPDRMWLAWVHRQSLGSLSRLGDLHPFDPRGDFVLRYGGRRADFEKQLTLTSPKGEAARP